MVITIVILSVLLTISICVNLYLGMSLDRNFERIDTLEQWIIEFKNDVDVTYRKLKDVDDKQMFQKDDDVGFVFSEIIKLIEKLNKRTE